MTDALKTAVRGQTILFKEVVADISK